MINKQKTYTVKDFAKAAFKHVDLNFEDFVTISENILAQ